MTDPAHAGAPAVDLDAIKAREAAATPGPSAIAALKGLASRSPEEGLQRWVATCEGCDGRIEIAVDPDANRALEWTSKCPYCDNGNEVTFVSAGLASRSPEDVFPAIEDVLAKHCRGYMDKPTTRENIVELIEKILLTYEREVQQRQLYQRQLEAVDRQIGFPSDEGYGRIEMIAASRQRVCDDIFVHANMLRELVAEVERLRLRVSSRSPFEHRGDLVNFVKEIRSYNELKDAVDAMVECLSWPPASRSLETTAALSSPSPAHDSKEKSK